MWGKRLATGRKSHDVLLIGMLGGQPVSGHHRYRLRVMRKAVAPILILAILATLCVFQREVLSEIFARLL
jgi:hypothetical protein